MKNKKGMAWMGLLVLAAIVLGVLWIGGVIGESPLQAVDSTPESEDTQCPTEDVTVTLAASNAYTGATVGGSHAYKVNDGKVVKTVADQGTFTASAGDKITVLFANHTNEGVFSYYGKVKEVTLPCGKGAYTIEEELVENSSISTRIFNHDDGNLNADGDEAPFSAGDLKTMKIELEATFEKGCPYGGVVVAERNSTSYDSIKLGFNNQPPKAEIVPQDHQVTNTNNALEAWAFPPVESTSIVTGQIIVDADDSVAAINDGDATLSFYCKNYFINGNNNNAFELAVSDEDGNSPQGHKQVVTLYLE